MNACPVDGCGARKPVNNVLCGAHWKMVPRDLQNQVYGAWRLYLKLRKEGSSKRTDAYRDWHWYAELAVTAVNERLASGALQ